jgi:hypothetical protein
MLEKFEKVPDARFSPFRVREPSGARSRDGRMNFRGADPQICTQPRERTGHTLRLEAQLQQDNDILRLQ